MQPYRQLSRSMDAKAGNLYPQRWKEERQFNAFTDGQKYYNQVTNEGHGVPMKMAYYNNG